MRKNLLITFDYELYLGNRSGTIHDCMIDPTNKLLEVMEPYGIKSLFFVDTTYLLRLKEQAANNASCEADFQMVANQLIALVQKGHYVFPHIHPHWLDAQYLPELNQWRLNNVNKYRFHNVSSMERSIVFDGSVKLLSEILHPIFPEYKINAYRAGGWGIQPVTDFLPFFNKHDFKYEFSVLGGIYQFTDAQHFDFSNSPSKPVYQFSTDVCIEDPNGKFTEFNISSIKISSALNFINKVWLKILYKLPGDYGFKRGEGQPSRIITSIKPVNPGGHNLSLPGKDRICVEDLTIIKLNTYLEFLEQNSYMHFISHPKMITRHTLSVFQKFLKKTFKKYEVETDFHKMIP